MANVILKNISGSSLSLNLLADTPAATLSTNQTINLLQYVSLSEATKSLQAGELKQAVIQQKISLIKNSIGFIKKSDANISLAINTLTATFRILPTGTSFSYNQQITDGNGNLVIQTHASTGDTIAITLTSGKSAFYSIYYNNSVLSYEDLSATSSTVFSDLLRVPVCIMWYDANTGTGWLFDQRQESYTDWSENLLLDKVQQIKYKSGLQLTNKTNCQAQFTPGTIIQNTSEINITNSLQTLNPLNARILYRKDSVANKKGYDWSVFDPTSLADILYYRTGNNVGYNSYGENGWSVVAAFANYYVPYWVVATNCSSTPIMVIVGQDQYSTLTEAQYQSRFDKLALENFIIRGFKPLYRLIIKNAASPIVVDTTDLRNEKLVADYISAGGVVVSGGGGETTLHQNLTDLQGGAWGEYYHLSSAQHTWLTDGVTAGRWGVTKGGTGINACAAGDIIYANAKDQFTVLSKGSIGQVLTMSEGQLPIWQTSSGGGGTTIHNNLIEMQGGTDAQYYHLTEAQHTWLTDGVTAGYWGTAKGGTGLTAYTFGDIIYASAADTLSTIHSGSTGQVLTMSEGKIPAWETLPVTAHNNLNEMQGGTTGEFYHLTSAQHTWLTAGVSAGYWGTAKGGTGLTTYAAGDIIYASAANTLAKLPKGTDGQILALASGLPSWINGNTLTGYTKPGATDYGAVALGVEAGASNALGMVAIGYQAAKSCTGYDVGDVVIGYGAGSSNISIYHCTLIGANAGVNIKTDSAGVAHSITAVGYGAISNTNGAYNATTIAYGSTALGVYAGRGKFFTNSIYIGVNSGRYTSDTPGTGGVTSYEGDCNIFIGHETGATDWIPPVSNSIAIGKRARFSKSNVAVIGASDFPINLGLNMTAPTARMHLPAGTSTAGTAPLKLTAGSNLTNPEDGVIEYGAGHLFFTLGTTRTQLDNQLQASSAVYVGYGSNSTNGGENVAVGGYAQVHYQSTAVGYSAQTGNGSYCTFVGTYTGGVNNAGDNTFIGYYAGNKTTGGYNTYLGSKANNSTVASTYCIAIGFRATAVGSNSIVIGTNNADSNFIGKGANTILIGNTAQTDTYIQPNILRIGTTLAGDKFIYAQNADASKPFIKYNDTTKQWEQSGDGTTSYAIGGYAASTAYAIPKALSNGKIHIGWIPTGITNDSVCIGNDSRLIASAPTNATTGQVPVSNGSAITLKGNVGRWWNSGVTPTGTPVSSSVVAVSGLTIKPGDPVRFLLKTNLIAIQSNTPYPSNITLTGLTGALVDYRGYLYFKNIVVSDPTYRIDIFSDELCTNKIAYTADFTANVTNKYTNIAISAYNSSGVTGTCDIDCANESRTPNAIAQVCFMRTGICTAYNGTNLTFAGQSVGTTANTVLEVWLGAPELVDQFPISIPGTYARLTTEQAFKDMLSNVQYWNGPNATLVMVKASQGTAQTGATPPKISPKINSGLLLADGVALSLSTADTVVSTVVNLDPLYSIIKFGDRIELKVQAGSTTDARDLSGVFIIVKD